MRKVKAHCCCAYRVITMIPPTLSMPSPINKFKKDPNFYLEGSMWCLVRFKDIPTVEENGSCRLFLKRLTNIGTNGLRVSTKKNFIIKNRSRFRVENHFQVVEGSKVPPNLIQFKKTVDKSGKEIAEVERIHWLDTRSDLQLEAYFKQKLGFSWKLFLERSRDISFNS